MNKPEPLKGKQRVGADCYDGKDIKLAVEWLKKEYRECFFNPNRQYEDEILKAFNNMVDIAFEDVMKK